MNRSGCGTSRPAEAWAHSVRAGLPRGPCTSLTFTPPNLAFWSPTPPDQVRIHTLDIDELIEIAESKLSRDMTEPECQQYFREPMPDGSSGQLTPPGEVDLSDEVSDASSSLGKSDPEAADIGAIPTPVL